MDVDLFNDWFRVADQDRDGLISGAEAVAFFQRSGLTQDTLFQVCAATMCFAYQVDDHCSHATLCNS